MADFITMAMETVNLALSGLSLAQSGIMAAAYLSAIPIVAIEWNNIIDILEGSGELFLGTIQSLKFVPHFLDAGVTLFEFSLSYLLCTLKLLSNFHKCWFYYVLDGIGSLCYLPFRITLWAFYRILSIDLYGVECEIWSYIDLFDRWFFTQTDVHLIHYDIDIRNNCYNCCRVKTEVLMQKGNVVSDDLMEVVPTLIWPGIENIINGVGNFMDPF